MENKMTKKELLTKLEALGELSYTQKKGIVCSLIGHSSIITTCFGYQYCSRCGEQLGDTLGGVGIGGDYVAVGHNCDKCRENYKKMGWKDKFLCPNPFN